jgi:hypothetical protein
MMVHTTDRLNSIKDSCTLIRKLKNGADNVHFVVDRVIKGTPRGLNIIVSGKLRADLNGLAVSATPFKLGGLDTMGSLVKLLSSKSPLLLLKHFPQDTKFYLPDQDAREEKRIKGKEDFKRKKETVYS